PRLHVCVVEAVIDRLGGKSGRPSKVNGVVELDRPCNGERDGERRVRTRGDYHARHRLVRQDCVSRAHYRLTEPEGIPSETDARLNIPAVLVINLIKVYAYAQQRGALRVEDNKAVVAFAWRHIPVVTQAEFERQV